MQNISIHFIYFYVKVKKLIKAKKLINILIYIKHGVKCIYKNQRDSVKNIEINSSIYGNLEYDKVGTINNKKNK